MAGPYLRWEGTFRTCALCRYCIVSTYYIFCVLVSNVITIGWVMPREVCSSEALIMNRYIQSEVWSPSGPHSPIPQFGITFPPRRTDWTRLESTDIFCTGPG